MDNSWLGVCGLLPKTLSLFLTKICDFLYPIYELTKNLTPISNDEKEAFLNKSLPNL